MLSVAILSIMLSVVAYLDSIILFSAKQIDQMGPVDLNQKYSIKTMTYLFHGVKDSSLLV
jgi:hypothetical protein